MKSKIFYRVSNTETNQGLWYDFNGKFTGLIHGKFNFCTNNSLEMPFDKDIVGWLSATESLDELFLWFPLSDIVILEDFGYKICQFEATDFKEYKNHKVISQSSSKFIRFISVDDIIKDLK